MIKTTYIFRGKAAEKAMKTGPKDFLYGLYGLSLPDFEIGYLIAPKENRSMWLRKFTYMIELPFSLITKLGLPIDIYLMNRRVIDESEIIVCVNDGIGLGMLFWKMLGLFRGKIVILAQSLPERLKYFKKIYPLYWYMKKLINKADLVLALSKPASKELETSFGVRHKRSKIFYFGVDTEFWRPVGRRKDFILSVGNDMNRDYDTLIKATTKLWKVKVLTKHKIKNNPESVEQLGYQTDEQLRQLFSQAAVVVIPSRKVIYESSGLSTALQAMACGAPVIISYSPALTEYFSGEKEGCIFYEPENPTDLRQIITKLMNDRELRLRMTNGARATAGKFTTKRMTDQMKIILSKL